MAFFTGLSSFIYEVGWIRMLSLVLGASTYSFELMLASFILGLALSPDGRYAFVATGLNPAPTVGVRLSLWDVASGKEVRRWRDPTMWD